MVSTKVINTIFKSRVILFREKVSKKLSNTNQHEQRRPSVGAVKGKINTGFERSRYLFYGKGGGAL